MTKTKRIIIFPDAHWPFVDKKAWALACKAAKGFKPDIFVNLGDCYDFNATKRHRKLPKIEKDTWSLQKELSKVQKAATDMLAIGAKRNVFIMGNHEDNFDRYIADRAPELAGLFDVPELVGLDEEKWEIVGYRDDIKIGATYYTHECGFSGANAVRQSQAAYGGNVVHGHTHRMDYRIRGNLRGQPHVGASFGWLGDVKQVDYMHRVSKAREMIHGFGYGYILPNGETHLRPAPIVKGKVIVEGKIYK
jgi:predicted phosphodiesterase